MPTLDQAPASAPAAARFGMAHAVVIVAFLAAAVILHLAARMTVRDVAFLLAAAGSISVAVLLAANTRGGRRGGQRLLRRLLNAVLAPGTDR
ncbi:hypothetical protein ADK76_08540 [Streptomyces griseoflavus]|uniref:hypothetical protein n=1 Tax=Streptomyces rimosus TaxID=1927 RepID=UPI0004CB2166|nr:hypothetical protein [Streptomyces rimosus]KOG64703.1 hypothetical protein ADK76_08540 [Streptomyces griseoflavus]